MSITNLQTAILNGGIYWNNFFNGRLLSGEDLSQEQADNLEGRRRLGRPIGDGVAFGLSTSETLGSAASAPTVTVTAGLAINRQGQTLALNEDTDVSLVRPSNGNGSAVSTFGECEPTQPGVYVAGAGVYLLTITPATGSDGRAPTSGLGNIAATCNTRYTVEGVQFRLLSLNNALSTELSDPAHLRNRVAYRCFGAGDPDVDNFFASPFGLQVNTYGLLDDLRPDPLTDCDVPLAVIYWTAAGIQFVDLWSVRRRLTKPLVDEDWMLLTSDRRLSEGEAMFLQFQAQIEEIRVNETNLGRIAATDRFQYLPPAGLLPLTGGVTIPEFRRPQAFTTLPRTLRLLINESLTRSLTPLHAAPGFDYQTFFNQLSYHPPMIIPGAVAEPLIRSAFTYPPINLAKGDPIWLYQLMEGTSIRPYLIFTSGYVPFRGEARYNIARWNYSNFT